MASSALAHSNLTEPTTNEQGQTIIVTASRARDAMLIDFVGTSVTVLGDQDGETHIVSDSLRDVPGAVVSRTGGVGGFVQLRLCSAEA